MPFLNNKNTITIPVLDEKRFQVIVGWGFPTASHGRKASELDNTVKLAALPPTILGLLVMTFVVGSKSATSALHTDGLPMLLYGARVLVYPFSGLRMVVESKENPLLALPLAPLLCTVGLVLLIAGLGVL